MNEDAVSLLYEHAGGSTYRDLAARHHISHEQARQLVIEAEEEMVFRIQTDFVTALRAQLAGRGPEWPSLIIPNGPDRTTAQRVFDAITKRLRTQGLPVTVAIKNLPTRVAGGGVVMSWVLDEVENERREAAKENH